MLAVSHNTIVSTLFVSGYSSESVNKRTVGGVPFMYGKYILIYIKYLVYFDLCVVSWAENNAVDIIIYIYAFDAYMQVRRYI